MQIINYLNKANFGEGMKRDVVCPTFPMSSKLDESKVKYIMAHFAIFSNLNAVSPAIVLDRVVISDINIWEAFRRLKKPIYYYVAVPEKGENIDELIEVVNNINNR